MTVTTQLLILIPIAYLLGSIPFGLIVGKMKGIDVRSAGSGNIGATNVGRLLGRKFFFLVFFLDLLKSLLPMVAASILVRQSPDISSNQYLLWIAVGAAAVVGHMFSLFLGFKGGKGVATSAGVVLGLYPYFTLAGLVAMVVFVVVFLIWRYVSLGSMLAAVSFPVAFVAIGKTQGWLDLSRQWPLLAFAMLMAVLIVYKHRANIARLRAGTENRMSVSA